MAIYSVQDDAPVTVPAGTTLHYKTTVGAAAVTVESLAACPSFTSTDGRQLFPKAVHLTAVTGTIWITIDGQTPDVTGLGLPVPSSGALRMPWPSGIRASGIKVIADGAGKIMAVTYEF